MPISENRLVEMLPRRDRRRLLAACEPVQLVFADVLHQPGRPTRHVYFPTDGFVSLGTPNDHDPGVEAGLIGREGMLGVQLVLGVAAAPLRAVVRGEGRAWRLAARPFRSELERNRTLQRVLLQYLYVLMTQLAESARCARFHEIGPRLARWLLMSHDRVCPGEAIRSTHELLACMLGVRRVGITAAASDLRRRGLIDYHRGDLVVLDRSGLEAVACGCYSADQRIYASILR